MANLRAMQDWHVDKQRAEHTTLRKQNKNGDLARVLSINTQADMVCIFLMRRIGVYLAD